MHLVLTPLFALLTVYTNSLAIRLLNVRMNTIRSKQIIQHVNLTSEVWIWYNKPTKKKIIGTEESDSMWPLSLRVSRQ